MVRDIKKAHVYVVSCLVLVLMIVMVMMEVVFKLIYPFDGLATSLFETMEHAPFISMIQLDAFTLILTLFSVFIYGSITLFLLAYKPLLAYIALVFGIIGTTLYMSQHTIAELHHLFSLYQLHNQLRHIEHAQSLLDIRYGTAYMMSSITLGIACIIYGVSLLIARHIPNTLGVIAILLGLGMWFMIDKPSIAVYMIINAVLWITFYSLWIVVFMRKINMIKKEVSIS